MKVFTSEDLDNRFRETRKITARLFDSPDYQEWLKRSLRPKLESLRADVMSADMFTEEGRNKAITAQIKYNALFTFLEDDLKKSGIAEEAFRDSMRRKESVLIIEP